MKKNDEITEALRCNIVPWEFDEPALNPTSGKYYTGMNNLILTLSFKKNNYKLNHWATYIQWVQSNRKLKLNTAVGTSVSIFAGNKRHTLINVENTFELKLSDFIKNAMWKPPIPVYFKSPHDFHFASHFPQFDFQSENKWYNKALLEIIESCNPIHGDEDKRQLVTDIALKELESIFKLPHLKNEENFEKWKLTWIEKIDKNYNYMVTAVDNSGTLVELVLKKLTSKK